MVISLEKSNALRRMLKGAQYLLRGDKAIGLEVRRDNKTCKLKEVNCRSLAPLLRDGLVEFAYLPTDISRYYEVRLTEAGERLVRELP